MDKIRELSKVILPDGMVLAEVKIPKRFIIAPDGAEEKDSYSVIIAVHPNIKDLKVGDIVVKYGGNLYGYTLNAGTDKEKKLALMNRGNINVAVKPENFIDSDVLTAKIKI